MFLCQFKGINDERDFPTAVDELPLETVKESWSVMLEDRRVSEHRDREGWETHHEPPSAPILGSATKRAPQFVLLISGKMLVPVCVRAEWTTYCVSFKCFFYLVNCFFTGRGVDGRVSLFDIIHGLHTLQGHHARPNTRLRVLALV